VRRLIRAKQAEAPSWGAEKGLECFDDDDEFRPPDAIWKVPVDCRQTAFARAAEPRPIPSPPRSRPRLIRQEDSDAISEVLKGNVSAGTIPFAVFAPSEEEQCAAFE
jgi:hypothetical protein